MEFVVNSLVDKELTIRDNACLEFTKETNRDFDIVNKLTYQKSQAIAWLLSYLITLPT